MLSVPVYCAHCSAAGAYCEPCIAMLPPGCCWVPAHGYGGAQEVNFDTGLCGDLVTHSGEDAVLWATDILCIIKARLLMVVQTCGRRRAERRAPPRRAWGLRRWRPCWPRLRPATRCSCRRLRRAATCRPSPSGWRARRRPPACPCRRPSSCSSPRSPRQRPAPTLVRARMTGPAISS